MKTFSEGIPGNIQDYSEKLEDFATINFEKMKVVKGKRGPMKQRPEVVEKAIEELRQVMRGEKTFAVDRRKAILNEYYKTIQLQRSKTKDIAIRRILEAEKDYLKRILKTDFTAVAPVMKKTASTVKKVEKEAISDTTKAEKILNTVAAESKTLQRSLTKKTIQKLIPKIIPLLGAGLLVLDLANRVKELLREKPEQFGEFYHRDVGWY